MGKLYGAQKMSGGFGKLRDATKSAAFTKRPSMGKGVFGGIGKKAGAPKLGRATRKIGRY